MYLKKKAFDENFVNEIREEIRKKYGNNALKKKKVLWIEWWTDGREIDQMKFCVSFLRDILKWDIDFISSFNPISILFKKYNFAIMSGTVGAQRGTNYASIISRDSSMPLFTTYTEGLFRESEIEEFIWGHQKNNKRNNWTSKSVWSNKYLNLVKKYYPEFSNVFYTSGCLGIDNYIIGNSKINKYDFGIILNDDIVSYKILIRKRGIKYAKYWQQKYHQRANEMLVKFIKKVSEIGFNICVKPHPGLKEGSHPILKKIRGLKNVSILDLNSQIKECLDLSKVVVTQNSTTSIQALCLKKPVFRVGEYPPCFDEYINFPKLEFLIEKIINNKFSINQLINEYDFVRLHKTIISKTVGFSDGFNHLRFIDSILRCQKISLTNNISFNFLLLKYSLIFYIFKFAYIIKFPFLKSFNERYKRFNIQKLNILLDDSSTKLLYFYSRKKKKLIKIFNE